MGSNKIRMSPFVRMSLTLEREMELDKNGAFGRETYEEFIKRLGEAEKKRDKLSRSLVWNNAAIFLLINGNSWNIPILDIRVDEIPAILEILIFSSSFTFFLFCAAFVTWLCYNMIVSQFGNVIVDSNIVDPEFYNSSRVHYDFYLKVFRENFNIFGVDFFKPRWGFRIFSRIITPMIIAVLMILPAAHFILIIYGVIEVYCYDWSEFPKWLFILSVILMNVGALALVVGMNKSFDFEVVEAKDDDEVLQPSE